MKQALILHGTDASPDQNWFPWLKAKLEAKGYNVWVPLLPQNHTPNRKTYGDFLLNGEHDLSDALIIGHSSGAVEVLNLLNDERVPHIKMAMVVSAWEHGTPPGMEASQFANLFPAEGYDYAAMKAKADKIAFMHGSDDPYCPLEQAQYLAKQLDASLTVVPSGHHLGAKYTELPELWEVIEPDL